MVIGRWRTGYYRQNKCAIIFPSTNERPTGVHNKEELFHGKKKKSSGPKQKLSLALLWKQKYLLLMSLPFVAWIILFKYVPLWGWTMAFQDVKPATFSVPIWERAFVGFENLRKLLRIAYFNRLSSIRSALVFCRLPWEPLLPSYLQYY